MNSAISICKLLKKVVLVVPIFLIIFFAFINVVLAAGFKYSSFNFKAFAEANEKYWPSSCAGTSDEEKCIKSQEKFYTKLYKLLAKKEANGYFIDDAIIIETVFFEYDPSAFSEISGAFTQDDDINILDDGENAAREFFEEEKDTLKLLVNAMIGYEKTCYGVTNPVPVINTNEDGSKSTTYTCINGGILRNIDGKGNVCLNNFDNNKTSINFYEKFLEEGSFCGIKLDEEDSCATKS